MAAAAACAPLPAGVAELHQAVLVGPHIVQVEHLWDMTITDEERRAPDRLPAQKRMLKVHLTDGHQRVCGIEYARIPQLAENTALGTTLVLHNVTVRCGLLFLTPSCVHVAGGAPGAAVAPATLQVLSLSRLSARSHLGSSSSCRRHSHSHSPYCRKCRSSRRRRRRRSHTQPRRTVRLCSGPLPPQPPPHLLSYPLSHLLPQPPPPPRRPPPPPPPPPPRRGRTTRRRGRTRRRCR